MQHLLLLHGAIGARDQLELLADNLKDKYIIHALNFGGHGGAALPDTRFSISLFADEAINFIKKENIQPVNIFGYSMGGYVALYVAKYYPEMVSQLITLATKFYWDKVTAEKEVKMLDPETILQKIPAFASQLERRHYPNDWKDLLRKTREMLLALGDHNTLNLDDYKSISIPCLLLLGEKDKMITLDETLAVQKALPNAEFRSLPGMPHPIEQVDMTVLSEIIKQFLK